MLTCSALAWVATMATAPSTIASRPLAAADRQLLSFSWRRPRGVGSTLQWRRSCRIERGGEACGRALQHESGSLSPRKAEQTEDSGDWIWGAWGRRGWADAGGGVWQSGAG